MKRSIVLVWTVVFLAFLAYLSFLAASLPERLAVHFDINGQPNGFQARADFITLFLWFALVLNGLFAAAFWFIDKMPMAMVNIPWKNYWSASPERWTEAQHRLRIVLGLTGLFVNTTLLVTERIIHQANDPTAENLIPLGSGLFAIFLLTALFVGTAFWVSKPPQENL